jgi:hypothetical protein
MRFDASLMKARRSHAAHPTRLVWERRLDDEPLKIEESAAQDLQLLFGSLNHARANNFRGKPPCPQWAIDWTFQRPGKITVNDQKQSSQVWSSAIVVDCSDFTDSAGMSSGCLVLIPKVWYLCQAQVRRSHGLQKL